PLLLGNDRAGNLSSVQPVRGELRVDRPRARGHRRHARRRAGRPWELPMIFGAEAELGSQLPLWSTVPFVLLLLSIALMPLFAGHWWERNRNKAIVAALLSAPLVLYMIAAHGAQGGYELFEQTTEYVSFMILLLALFIISGGIFIKGSLSGTPLMNTVLI